MKGSVLLLAFFMAAACAQKNAEMEGILYTLNQQGTDQEVGRIVVQDLQGKGIAVTVSATNVQPGIHGFHLHETNLLGIITNDKGAVVVGGQAGSHWDPDQTGQHLGPDGNGHRGDLPQVTVNENGILSAVITNTKIQFEDVKGKSFMVHTNPDNYADDPLPLGGSGGRLYAAPF